jgi:acyl dehydratase
MPIHIDLDFARKFGLKDVFAHGMLSMAYLGQLLTRTVRQENIRFYKTRFTAITPVGATVTCSGTLVDLHEEAGERRARLALRTQIDDGTVTMEGEAIVALA